MSMSLARRSRVTVATLLAAPVLVIASSQGAFAQSTGTVEAENLAEVVVTGRRIRQLAGVTDQNATKSRVSVTGEFLQNYAPGQTFLDSLNQVPGLNFTNSDAYGSSGGNLRLRGFDGSRVSLTFDGIPLNDTGNYAIYTNQQIDPELIEAVDVNLGTTDVDSPTASAVGGTINNRTRRPAKEMGGLVSLSGGEDNFRRVFGMFETGEFGPLGTRAYIAGSYARNDKFKGPGEIYKRQFNARVQQDLDDGNFVALNLHFNRNRNNFYRNASEATFLANGRQFDNLATCTRLMGTAGVADNEGSSTLTGGNENPLNPGACTNYYNLRINPSDTGNIRINSLWHLTDSLRLAVDPSFQYTLANGGGTQTIGETPSATGTGSEDRRVVGASGRTAWDLNGDGDTLDTVRLYTPNTTNTKRYGVNASLIWDLSDSQRLRLAYAFDYGKHRQTADFGYLDAFGNPENVFAGRQGRKVPTADGSNLRGRDRYSIAQLNQISAEYRGKFLDNRLTTTIGIRAPFFKRELNQYCYSLDATTNVLCTTQAPATTLANGNVTFGVSTRQYIPPYEATAKFDEILPNVGLSYALTDNQTVYASYAGSLSAPRVDSLYAVRRLADGSIARANPDPEKTDSFDLGWRYSSEGVIASVVYWQSQYKNRIVSSFDPDLGFFVDRNVGDVDLKGVDMQVGWRANDWMTVSANLSYNDSELKNDLRASATATLPTKGKKFVETPEYTYGARIDLSPFPKFSVGFEGKYVDERFTTDINDAKVASYTLFHLNASYEFDVARLEGLSAKVVVYNLFDEEFFGNISSSSNAITTAGVTGSAPFLSLGAPRSISLTIQARF